MAKIDLDADHDSVHPIPVIIYVEDVDTEPEVSSRDQHRQIIMDMEFTRDQLTQIAKAIQERLSQSPTGGMRMRFRGAPYVIRY